MNFYFGCTVRCEDDLHVFDKEEPFALSVTEQMGELLDPLGHCFGADLVPASKGFKVAGLWSDRDCFHGYSVFLFSFLIFLCPFYLIIR